MTRSSPVPATLEPTPEQRRLAAVQFERASQLIAGGGYASGIALLMDCCRREPANLLYRQALRRAQKARFNNNLRGSGWLGWLMNWPLRARLKLALRAGRYLAVLRLGERILYRNPWDVSTQLDLAAACEALGLSDLAVWNLEQARHKEPDNPDLNRRLARFYEQRGQFTQALTLWGLVQATAPLDEEACARLARLHLPVPVAEANASMQPLSTDGESRTNRLASYRDRARQLRTQGRFDEAARVLDEGLAETGQAFELCIERMDLGIEPFRRDLALTRQQLASGPDDSLTRIAQQLQREIDTRELDLYRQQADRYPGQLVHRLEVGLRLLRLGQAEEAESEFRACGGDETLRAEGLVGLGWALRARRKTRQALQAFEEALTCLPEAPPARRLEVMIEAARCHADLGDLARATELGNEVVRLDPTREEMPRLLAVWNVTPQG